MILGVARSSFVSDDFAAQTVSLLVRSPEGNLRPLTVHAKGLACDLITLRCVLDGHVEVPHLADAEKDRYSSLLKDVDVGTARRSCVISKTQGPIYPGGLSVCNSELGLDQLPIDLVHQNRIGRVVLRVDDRRHQLCCQKAVICCLKLYLIGSASRGWPFSQDAHMHHGMPLTLVLCWMSHGMSTSHVHSMSMIDPSLGLSNRHR